MKPGKMGVWYPTDGMTADAAVSFARRIEQLGYSTLWIPEALGRHPFAHAAWLLANTSKLQVATGIASIYNRDPGSTMAAALTLAEQSGGRFILGLGVSHQVLVETLRGHSYGKPVSTMAGYLDKMRESYYQSVRPQEEPPVVLAALGGNMLNLAASRAQGALPYFTSPEHTAIARQTMGEDAWLCVEQKVILEADPEKARGIARAAAEMYISLPNYRNSWLRLGFEESDFDGAGSDRFIDRLFAWGELPDLQRRVAQHLSAGADHVCIQPLNPRGSSTEPDWRVLESMSEA